MTKKSANARKNVRQWKMNYKKIHNQHKHQNLTPKHIHSLAVIRAMVEANRTTGTVDNARDLETHSEDTTDSRCEPFKHNPHFAYSVSDNEYTAGGKVKKQDQKTNHEDEQMNNLSDSNRELMNDDPISKEHSRRTSETRYRNECDYLYVRGKNIKPNHNHNTLRYPGTCNRENDEFTTCVWKVGIGNPCKGQSKWCVRFYAKCVAGKAPRLLLGYCNSRENAEVLKSRVLDLLLTMPALEIKAQFDMENEKKIMDWNVYVCTHQKKWRVVLVFRKVNGKRSQLYVGSYETKLEAENARVLAMERLETLDPHAVIAQFNMLESETKNRVHLDNLIPGEHDDQQESVRSLPFIVYNLQTSETENENDARNVALDRIALFKAYYQRYISSNRPPVFWVPRRDLENTKLAILPNGLPMLTTKDRSSHSQIPKTGKTAIRLYFILDSAVEMLNVDTTMRQRYVCVLFFIN